MSTVNANKFEIDGVEITTSTPVTDVSEALVTLKKELRVTLDADKKQTLFQLIMKKQHTLFEEMPQSLQSVKDLQQTYDLSLCLSTVEMHLACYDVISVFTIVFPVLDTSGNQTGTLALDSNGKVRTSNLFTQYNELTPDQVAQSTIWFLNSERSPIVYLSEECKGIVGNVGNHPFVRLVLDGKNTDTIILESTDTITKLKGTDTNSKWPFLDAKDANNSWKNAAAVNFEVPDGESNVSSTISHSDGGEFWFHLKQNVLLLMIIAVPYRPGSHLTRKPRDSVPIINQLQELHSSGFVHGDIRAFNTVFGENVDEGWLIDFDFGGKIGDSTKYPKGYCQSLDDGLRKGEGGNPIFTWHDWFAFGRIIFYFHKMCRPKEIKDELLKLYDCSTQWEELNKHPAPEMIEQLREFLCDLDERGWTVRPTGRFEVVTKKMDCSATNSRPKKGTNEGATVIHAVVC